MITKQKFVRYTGFFILALGFSLNSSAETYTISNAVTLRLSNEKASNSEMIQLCKEAPSVKPQIQIIDKLKATNAFRIKGKGKKVVCVVEYTFPDKNALCSESKVLGGDTSSNPKVDASGYTTAYNGSVKIIENNKLINQLMFDEICNASVKI